MKGCIKGLFWFVLILAILLGLLGWFLRGALSPDHTCVFDQEIVAQDYLCSQETCKEPAKYYYSCECGEKGDQIFSYGECGEHKFTNYTFNNDATCGVNGTETAYCDYECGDIHTRTKTGSALQHDYSTCISNGNGTHTKTCSRDNTHVITENCHGGNATCSQAKICVDCKTPYGKHVGHRIAGLDVDIEINQTYQYDEVKYMLGEGLYYSNNDEDSCSRQAYFNCVFCNNRFTIIVQGTHNFKLQFNTTQHWKSCTCGTTQNREYHYGGQATCKKQAICVVCNQSYGELGDHKFENKICVWCGLNQSDTETFTTDGTYVWFGKYPQSKVSDSNITNELLNLSGNPLVSTSGWTSYNYYSGAQQADIMYYIDVPYEGEKYRGVYIKEYRPYEILYNAFSNEKDSYQDDNHYYKDKVYWFKWDPIVWKIIYDTDDATTLIPYYALDAMNYDYQSTWSTYNYKNSTIRKWLNEDFYNSAFNDLQKELILTTTVANGLSSSIYEENPNACEDTYDKIFLLSVSEVQHYTNSVSDRQFRASSYALAQGVKSEPMITWLTRTPSTVKGVAWIVDKWGDLTKDLARNTYYGILPALQIKLK